MRKTKAPKYEESHKQVRMFIDLLKGARRVRAENTNLPDDMLAQQEQELEGHLRNTFGLIYIQAPFTRNLAERRAIAVLKKEVRKVLPDYVKGLLPKKFDPEAAPEKVPKGW
jgi:hypothetical protein